MSPSEDDVAKAFQSPGFDQTFDMLFDDLQRRHAPIRSTEHKQLFEESPAKYEPQFGGFCGYAASINKLAPIEVEYFQVLHDRLILQHNKKAWDLWHKDIEGNLKNADANWPTSSQQKP